MPDSVGHSQVLNLDLKLLAKFIYELNIARHHTLSYPVKHPLIGTSLARALDLFHQLAPENDTLSLGITNGTLWHGHTALDQKNPVFREFAAHLFSRGVVLISFQTGLNVEELDSGLRLLGKTRHEILEQGGLQQVMKETGVVHLVIQQIDYGRFHTVDADPSTPPRPAKADARNSVLWERFVTDLLASRQNGKTEKLSSDDLLSPESLAALLNEQTDLPEKKIPGHYDQAIIEFLRETDREKLTDEICSPAVNRLKTLAANLNPELRCQMLNSTFRELAKREETAERFLEHFPESMLVEVVENLNARQEAIPPVIFKLLSQLAPHTPPQGVTAIGSSTSCGFGSLAETGLEPLFRPDKSALFTTAEYHGLLKAMSGFPACKTDGTSGSVYYDAFFDAGIEKKTCDIIFELAETGMLPDEGEILRDNLFQLWDHLLDIGDFDALAEIYRRHGGPGCSGNEAATEWRRKNLPTLHRREVVNEVLDSLPHWGKEKFPEILRLITAVGTPFVEPLLDRLAEENKRSVRFFFIDCLVELGKPARDGTLARLQDSRWYYLRNLLIVLRRQGDPSVMTVINHLRDHPHEAVRQEWFKTANDFADPQKDQMLLEDLAHPQPQRRIKAIQMARHSRHPRVFQILLSCLETRDLSAVGFEVKSAVLHTLATLGNPEALPVLGRVFLSTSFLHPRRQRRLRILILNSLSHYPAEDRAKLLEQLVGTRRPGLARLIVGSRGENLERKP